MTETWGPRHQELIAPGGMIAAVRSAPWSVWVGAALLTGIDLGNAAFDPTVGAVVVLPFALLFAGMLLVGSRIAWQLALIFAAGDVFFVFAPNNSAWSAGAGALAIVLLLLPTSRRYFSPGRVWVPRSVSQIPEETLEKGGLRQVRLEVKVPAHLAPRQTHAFFVACRDRGERSAFSRLFRREFVVAAADDHVVVLALRRPGPFRSDIGATVVDLSADDPALTWDEEAFTVEGRDYRPVRHHDRDADAVALWLSSAQGQSASSP